MARDHSNSQSNEKFEAPIGFPVFRRQLNRRDLLRITGGVMGVAALQGLLAACGGSSSNNTSTATTSSSSGGATSTATSSSSSTSTAAASASPGAGATKTGTLVNPGNNPPSSPTGTLNVAMTADPTNLDPIATYSLGNGRWESNVFSPLVWRDPNLVLYDGKNGDPGPDKGFGLAESWNYSDNKTLEMKLVSGATFQDGEPFNATAVKSTFDRLLDPANKSPQTFNYSSIDSVEVVDDQTVRFHFKEVDPVMITKLAGYGAFLTPPNAVKDATTFGTKQAIGSGPYKISEYAKDDHLTLAAWDGYFSKSKPHIQTINYRVIPDDNTRLSEFLAGNIDVLTLNVSQASAAKGNPKLQVVPVGVPTVSGLRLDTKKAPTDNLNVRKAIGHAIDLDTIVKTILGGYAKPVGIWQSPFSFGYENYAPYPYDQNAAKQALQASGVSSPHVVYDVIGSDTQAKEMASAIKDMLTSVGFQVDIQQHDQATYYSDYVAGKLHNIVPFGWGGWTLDYDNTYYSMYYTKQSYNPSYSNPALDKLLDQERATLDQSVRLNIAKQCNKIIYDDYVDVALYQNVYLWGISNRVKNFLIPPDERLWWLDAYVTG